MTFDQGEALDAECDNCIAEHRTPKPAITLADSMKLCADCWAELRVEEV